jgi:hypothetical protein
MLKLLLSHISCVGKKGREEDVCVQFSCSFEFAFRFDRRNIQDRPCAFLFCAPRLNAAVHWRRVLCESPRNWQRRIRAVARLFSCTGYRSNQQYDACAHIFVEFDILRSCLRHLLARRCASFRSNIRTIQVHFLAIRI